MSRVARCKIRINYVSPESYGTRVTASAVYSDDPASENKQFWDATPQFSLDMTVTNKAAAEHLKAGQELYVDFIPIEAERHG